MRKLLLFLVLANLLYYAYTRFNEPEKENIVVFRGEKGVPLLVTLEELERPPAVTSHVPIEVNAAAIQNKRAGTSEENAGIDLADAAPNGVELVDPAVTEDAAADPANGASKPAEPLVAALTAQCQTIGPYADLAVAKASRVGLEKAGLEVKNRKEVRQITGAYWVYLPAYEDKEQARAASKVLADNGVKDYFIISDEENQNGISLGLYNQKSGSERRRTDIAKLGFEPLIARKERQREFWWLDLEPTSPVQEKTWRVDGVAKDIKLSARDC